MGGFVRPRCLPNSPSTPYRTRCQQCGCQFGLNQRGTTSSIHTPVWTCFSWSSLPHLYRRWSPLSDSVGCVTQLVQLFCPTTLRPMKGLLGCLILHNPFLAICGVCFSAPPK